MKSSERLAIAVDLGTTTIAASLLDLQTQVRLAATGNLNPQREFGSDVVSRMQAACASAEALKKMKRLVNLELERLVEELLAAAGASRDNLHLIAIAGNPAMEHLLLGLPVASLAFPPYRPLFHSGKTVNTAALGWDMAIDTFVFPLPGGFVGGDLVAFLHGADGAGLPPPDPSTPLGPLGSSGPLGPVGSVGSLGSREPGGAGLRLYLDLGTNGEIALTADERIYATSAAAGPAFEGGGLEHGMTALSGAISSVRFEGDRVSFSVIGEAPPAGICGSGVIEAIAGLLPAGVLDETGRLLAPLEIASNLANRVMAMHGERAFVLYRDAAREVCLTQRDIRQVQLAKAAIRAGIEVLFEKARIGEEALQETVVTGSFGARLTAEGLKKVGILPEKMVETCTLVRDGALAGVEKAVLTPGGFEAVDRLALSIRVIPLSGTPAFEKHFLEHMNFPQL